MNVYKNYICSYLRKALNSATNENEICDSTKKISDTEKEDSSEENESKVANKKVF